MAMFVAAVGVATPVLAATLDCCAPDAACCTGGDCCQK
jgi:hypothetical protein